MEETKDVPALETPVRILDRKISPRTIATSFSSNLGRKGPEPGSRERAGSARSVRAIVKWIEEEKMAAAPLVAPENKTKPVPSSFRIDPAERSRGDSAASSSYSSQNGSVSARVKGRDGTLELESEPGPAFADYAIPAAQAAALRNKPVFRSPDVEDYSLTLLKHRMYLNNRPLARCLDEEEGSKTGREGGIRERLAVVRPEHSRKSASSPCSSLAVEEDPLSRLLEQLEVFGRQTEASNVADPSVLSVQPVEALVVNSHDWAERKVFWANVRAQLNTEDDEAAEKATQDAQSMSETWSISRQLAWNKEGSSSSAGADREPDLSPSPFTLPISPPPDKSPPPVPQRKPSLKANPFATPPFRPPCALPPLIVPFPLAVTSRSNHKPFVSPSVIDDPFRISPAAPPSAALPATTCRSSPLTSQEPIYSASCSSVYDADNPLPKLEETSSQSPALPVPLAQSPPLSPLPQPADKPAPGSHSDIATFSESFLDSPYARYLASLGDPGPPMPANLPIAERRSRARQDSLARLEGSSPLRSSHSSSYVGGESALLSSPLQPPLPRNLESIPASPGGSDDEYTKSSNKDSKKAKEKFTGVYSDCRLPDPGSTPADAAAAPQNMAAEASPLQAEILQRLASSPVSFSLSRPLPNPPGTTTSGGTRPGMPLPIAPTPSLPSLAMKRNNSRNLSAHAPSHKVFLGPSETVTTRTSPAPSASATRPSLETVLPSPATQQSAHAKYARGSLSPAPLAVAADKTSAAAAAIAVAGPEQQVVVRDRAEPRCYSANDRQPVSLGTTLTPAEIADAIRDVDAWLDDAPQ